MCVCVYLSECFLWVLCKSSTGRKLYSWSSRENMGKTRMNGIAYMCVSVLLMLCSPLLSSPLWKSIFFLQLFAQRCDAMCFIFICVCSYSFNLFRHGFKWSLILLFHQNSMWCKRNVGFTQAISIVVLSSNVGFF